LESLPTNLSEATITDKSFHRRILPFEAFSEFCQYITSREEIKHIRYGVDDEVSMTIPEEESRQQKRFVDS